MEASKNFEDDVMSRNCDIIIIFPTDDQFGAIQKPNSGGMVCEICIFINSNLLPYKNWKQNSKFSNTALIILLWVKILFLKNICWFFCKKKHAETNQNKRILVLKGIFSGTKYVCGLIYQISSFQHTHNEIYTRLILPTPTSHHYHCYPSNHRKTNI